jgi:alpha-1,2-mannosyltransferase
LRLLTRIVALGFALYLTGPLAVGLSGLGVPSPLALVLSLGLVCAAALELSRRLTSADMLVSSRHQVALAVAIALLFAGVYQVSRLSVFIHDINRQPYAAAHDAFRIRHSCLSAYAEAARLQDQVPNVYSEDLYANRRIGPLRVDAFHYPPPFLLLPGAIGTVAHDFFTVRRVWFALQAVVLVVALLRVAVWIGGTPGLLTACASALVLAAPQTSVTLQIGNFQITAICAAMLAAVLIGSGRVGLGAGLLAFVTVGKIFPGVLGVYLTGAQRWRAVLAAAAWGAAITGLTAALFGIDVFTSFLAYELPRIHSGAAFPQAEVPSSMVVNQSVYGLLTKLRTLGVTILDRELTVQLAAAYGYVLIAAALFLGMGAARLRPATPGLERLERVRWWLALLNLASFRSPFVGGGYGSFGTVWLLSLLMVGDSGMRRWVWTAMAGFLMTFIWFGPTNAPGTIPAPSTFALSASYDIVMLSANIWVIATGLRRTLYGRVGVRTMAPAAQTTL